MEVQEEWDGWVVAVGGRRLGLGEEENSEDREPRTLVVGLGEP